MWGGIPASSGGMNTFATKPRSVPELDPDFQPAVLWNRAYLASVKDGVPLLLALEGELGRVSRYGTVVRPGGDAETLRYVERLVKFLLWSRGGWRLVAGARSAKAASGANPQGSGCFGGARKQALVEYYFDSCWRPSSSSSTCFWYTAGGLCVGCAAVDRRYHCPALAGCNFV